MGARVPLRAGPSLNQDEIRRRVAGARAATLATLDGDGRPHLVPITFVLSGDELFTAVDHKPKTTRALKRLANIRHDPRVTVLVHSYDEDWAKLWWCRLRGEARVEYQGPDFEHGVEALSARYDQYRGKLPAGPVIRIVIDEWTGWASVGLKMSAHPSREGSHGCRSDSARRSPR